MSWELRDRLGRSRLAAGTLEQMLAYLRYTVKDGEYRLVGQKVDVNVRRFRGVIYPFDLWEGWAPAEVVKQVQSRVGG